MKTVALSEWTKHYDWPSKASMERLVHAPDKTGFRPCFDFGQRRIRIPEFITWVERLEQYLVEHPRV